jgi:FtsH-binding integral membrane protein
MEDLMNVASVPAITAIVYWVVNLIKYTTRYNEKVLTFIPLMSCGIGITCGIIAFFVVPQAIPTNNLLVSAIIGGASGLTATGFNQIVKQFEKGNIAKK